MYASIYKYAKEHDLVPVRNRAMRTPVVYICIDSDGKYERLDIVPKANREKRQFPDIGRNRAASGKKANIICDKKEYIFCIPDDKGDYTGNAKKHEGWMEITQEGSSYSDTLYSIWQFCSNLESDRSLYESVDLELTNAGVKGSDFISFRIDGKRAEEATDWEDWFDQRMATLDRNNKGTAKEGISLITGKPIIPIQEKEKFPQIMTSQTRTGAPIYSCAHKTVSGSSCAFTSYGVIDSLGSPMSIEEAEAIKVGLETLLGSDSNHNDQFNIIYWYDQEESTDLINLSIFGGFEDDNEDEIDQSKSEDNAYKMLLEAINSGKVPEQNQGSYHIIHYEVPARGRFYLDGEKCGRYAELCTNIYRWYSDSSITTGYWDPSSKAYVTRQRYLTKLYRVLFCLLDHKEAKDKLKECKNEYGEDIGKLLEAIYENRQIPEVFYHKALKQTVRIFSSNSFSDEGRSLRKKTGWPIPIQIIKVYLVRSGKDNYSMDALNSNNASVAYNCGRLLATIDRLQYVSAETKLNLTIGQKYFRSASRTPGKIMTMALENEQNYLKKLKNEGTRIFFVHLFGELSEKIGMTIPEKFSRTEQGEFMLGYFYQSNEFFKKDNKTENNDTNDANDGEKDKR